MPHQDPQYVDGVELRPERDRHFESNVKGLHIVGAASGSPLLKTCINEGVEVVRSISRLMGPSSGTEGPEDLIIVGAGPAGLAAALEAKKRDYRFVVLEQGRPLNTILNFPDGKHIYAEPANLPTQGEMGLQDATKEQLLEEWGRKTGDLNIAPDASVSEIHRQGELIGVRCEDGRAFHGRRVIVAIGRMGNPRKLDVPGEGQAGIYTVLLNPGKYAAKDLLVVGGGNSAVEAALMLLERNRVTLVHRGETFSRVSRTNRAHLEEAEHSGRVRILRSSRVKAFGSRDAQIEHAGEVETIGFDSAFVLIGADPPVSYLRRLGVVFEGEWRWRVLPQMAWVFALICTVYAIKGGYWPFQELYARLEAAKVPPGLLYGILYTGLMSVFGLRALAKYRDDPYQVKRYQTLIASQWLIYFLLPWVLYYAGYSEWWRSWGVTLTYPLGYYALFEPAAGLFSGSVLPWAIASLLAFLVVMPIVGIYHGKRFCSWVCPCGGIADTVGDVWRHKSPRGLRVRRLESAQTVILVLTVLASVYLISGYRAFLSPEDVKTAYKLVVDLGLASIVAITLYPFYGSRVWCRFFCPLAKWMELWGRWTGGKLAIVSNEECISCGRCTRYCQMGIDVRAFAQREQALSNRTTECIFCGICVTVCPVDVLRVERLDKRGQSGS